MKIAYLSHSPLLSPVANAVHVMKMCSAFADNGHEVTLYARGSRQTQQDIFAAYGVEKRFRVVLLSTRAFGRPFRRVMYGLVQAYRAKTRDRPDIYYARCMISAVCALLLGGQVVLEVHEVPRKRSERRILRWLLQHRRLRRVVTISHALLEDLRKSYPGVSCKCVVAADGASIGTSGVAFPLRRGAGRQIGYAGGLRPGNGVQLILDLADSRRADTFHVLGGSSEEIAAWRARQKSTNVVWYGRCDPAHVPGFLSACDVLLAPYENGPKTSSGRDTSRWMSPLKIFEYMASGRPMIVSDFPVLREVLSEEVAVITEPANLTAWIRALDGLEDECDRERLGARALSVFRQRFTWEARARDVLRGLEQPSGAEARGDSKERRPTAEAPTPDAEAGGAPRASGSAAKIGPRLRGSRGP